MTIARDIITGAYQRLGLLPLGANLDPDRAAAGLATYNDMLNAWGANGIFPGGPHPAIHHADGLSDCDVIKEKKRRLLRTRQKR